LPSPSLENGLVKPKGINRRRGVSGEWNSSFPSF
jgi:hypothetical protein